jgi:ATP-binding cassette subfamily F protein 3
MDLQLEVQRGERWASLGANGSGKTTLLRTITGAVAPLAGEVSWTESLEYGYYDQQLATLQPNAQVLDEIRELDSTATDGELRSYLGQFLFSGDEAFKKVGSLSGGEKSRLALAKIIYEEPQLLALDEPTNHLDIASREALESALIEYPGTILFVTHDRYLTQKIATHLLYLEDGRPYIFDRLSAFEEWLSSPRVEVRPDSSVRTGEKTATGGMSKNRREKLQAEVASLEQQIAAAEKQVAELESSFQEPDPRMDWEATHRRYDELKSSLEGLYADLEARLDLL